jgi:hypothetical protein
MTMTHPLSQWRTPRFLPTAVFGWFMLAAVGAVAWRHSNDLVFLPWRSLETLIVLTLACAAAWSAQRTRKLAVSPLHKLESGLRLVFSALLAVFVLGQEGPFRWQQYKVFQANKAAASVIEHSAGWPALFAAVHEGDIIFHTARSAQSHAIQQLTGSRYTHLGLILFRDAKPYVLEASAEVKYTPLAEWIARGAGGRYVIKRLETADQTLTPQALQQLRQTAETFLGTPYDLTFEWSDNRIYASELVWKTYHRALGINIGELQKASEFNHAPEAVRQKIIERYGSKGWSPEETVISPNAIFHSPLLVEVTRQ